MLYPASQFQSHSDLSATSFTAVKFCIVQCRVFLVSKKQPILELARKWISWGMILSIFFLLISEQSNLLFHHLHEAAVFSAHSFQLIRILSKQTISSPCPLPCPGGINTGLKFLVSLPCFSTRGAITQTAPSPQNTHT